MARMTRKAERQAWTDFFERSSSASSKKGVGICSECNEVVPPARLQKGWKTCSVACGKLARSRKYGGEPLEFNGRVYPSKREARVAQKLQLLEAAGAITELRYQERIIIAEGRDGVRAVTYWADFTYRDSEGVKHVIDAKGMKTAVYNLKKRLLKLLHNIEIEEE